MNKLEMFRNGVIEFRDSEKNSKDYLKFIVVCFNCLKFGSGLVWSQIERVLEEEIGKFETETGK